MASLETMFLTLESMTDEEAQLVFEHLLDVPLGNDDPVQQVLTREFLRTQEHQVARLTSDILGFLSENHVADINETEFGNLISRRVRWIRQNAENEPVGGTRKPRPASKFIINSLEEKPLTEGEMREENFDSVCAICRCEYEKGDLRSTIPECDHVLHSACLKAWLGTSNSCPMCRVKLRKEMLIIKRTREQQLHIDVMNAAAAAAAAPGEPLCFTYFDSISEQTTPPPSDDDEDDLYEDMPEPLLREPLLRPHMRNAAVQSAMNVYRTVRGWYGRLTNPNFEVEEEERIRRRQNNLIAAIGQAHFASYENEYLVDDSFDLPHTALDQSRIGRGRRIAQNMINVYNPDLSQ